MSEKPKSAGTCVDSLLTALRAARIGHWTWDVAADRVFWSPEVYDLVGCAPGAFAGTVEAFLATVHPDDRDRVAEVVNNALATGEGYRLEHRIANTERWVECCGCVFRDEQGRAVRLAGVVLDCTERKRMDAQLRDAERMATLGGVTASVAHELNNPLA
ncbi:MAG: PAS domain-containing protein, partial [Myxococcales bacterium]